MLSLFSNVSGCLGLCFFSRLFQVVVKSAWIVSGCFRSSCSCFRPLQILSFCFQVLLVRFPLLKCAFVRLCLFRMFRAVFSCLRTFILFRLFEVAFGI